MSKFSKFSASRILCWTVIFLAVLVVIIVKTTVAERRNPMTLAIALRGDNSASSEQVNAEIFFRDDRTSKSIVINAEESFDQVLNVPLPAERIRYVGIRPLLSPGRVTIEKLTLLGSQGECLRALKIESLEQIGGGGHVRKLPDGLEINWNGDGNKPELIVNTSYPLEDSVITWPVTPRSLYFFLGVSFVFLVLCIGMLARAFIGGGQLSGPNRYHDTLQALIVFAVLALIIFGSKLYLVERIAWLMPMVDEWDAIAWTAYLPFVNNALSWKTLFDMHGEHILFWQRVWSLWLLQLNGSWNPLAQVVANALLHTGIVTATGISVWILAKRRFLIGIAALMLCRYALPFAWENTRYAFHSQFYFAELFCIGACVLISSLPLTATKRWLSALFAFLGLFANSAALLLGPALIAVGFARSIRERSFARETLWLIAVGTSLILYGFLLMRSQVQTRLNDVTDFLIALGHALAWPNSDSLWNAFLLWMPFTWLLIRYLKGGLKDQERLCQFLLILGCWVMVLSAAITFARFYDNNLGIGSRHSDLISTGLLVNGISLMLLFSESRFWWGDRVLRICGAFWWPMTIKGLIFCSLIAFTVTHDEDRAGNSELYDRFLDRHDYTLSSTLNSYADDRLNAASALNNKNFRAILPSGSSRQIIEADFPIWVGERLSGVTEIFVKGRGWFFLGGLILGGAMLAFWCLARLSPWQSDMKCK